MTPLVAKAHNNPDYCPYRERGCPDCTGLTWAGLHDREADRETNERDRQPAENYGWTDWNQR